MFVILLLTASLASQDRVEYRIVSAPGTIESAISLNPQSVVRHELGSLAPPGVVKLFAVVAVDQSKRTVKGLEVQIEGDDIWNNNRHCKDSVYMDEDGLAEFESRLSSLVQSEKRLESDSALSRSDIPSTVFAGNRANNSSKDGVFYVPVEFGYYWSGSRYGVYVLAPHSEPTTGPHQTCQFRMPQADISDLLPLVRDGRVWLDKGNPKVQASEPPKDNQP